MRIAVVAFVVALVVAAQLLAGCGVKTTPEVRIVTQRVEVPIRVPCKPARSPAPAYAADSVPLDASLFDLVRSLLVDREQRKARESELVGAIDSCG